MNAVEHRPFRERLAPSIVRLAAAWILAGAAFKLIWGSPADLPAILHDVPMPLGTFYRLAIAVELTIGLLALLVPALVAPAVAALLAFFCALLVAMAWRGDASCGCFGTSVTIPPLAMLAIDGALLVLLLALRPWRRRTVPRRSWVAPLALAVTVAAVASPWLLDRELAAPAGEQGDEAGLPGYVVLDVEDWVGRPLAETPLGRFLDPGVLPSDGLLVVYRMTCSHCAEDLFELAASDDGTRPITLVRVIDDGEQEADHVVEIKPEGPHVRDVALPRGVDWVVTTPAELELEAGVIVAAREGGSL